MNSPRGQEDGPGPPVPDGSPRSRLHRLLEPRFLFTGIALLLLAWIWGTTINLAAGERAASARGAGTLTADVADTYEAQVVRALREIDSTLKLVRYSLGEGPAQVVLQQLRARQLLPPDLLFTVSVTDARGNVLASTHAFAPGNVSEFDFFQDTRSEDGMVIGAPRLDHETGEWRLYFSRRLQETGRRFSAGIVVVSVHAGYFVSGYESDVMGDQGVLGLVGTDGVFRTRRSGNRLYAGDRVDYETLVARDTGDGAPAFVEVNSWDGVRRYTIIRKLYEFPVAIVVGLSEAEQLAPASRLARVYLWRAAGLSVLVTAILAVLGRLSSQLHQARTRVMEERLAHAHRVEYLAYHDNLTNLPNRAFFTHLLSRGMQQARRYRKRLALLFLDLDRFKSINDSLGHDAGDELLQEVGRRLVQAVRESDTVARLGGDEFVVMLPEITAPSQVTPVAEKMVAALGKPFRLAGQEFRITVSIGIGLFPGDGEDEQTLMKNADIAMYHAKEEGRNNFQFYSEKLNADSLERLALESSLRKALEYGELRLFYQAKRDMGTGRITGTEALLRWKHPDLGLILPMQFIPLAEDTGLIVPIGRWVLKTACQQNVAWQKEGCPPLSMAVNLSARQFLDEGLLEDIKSALREADMAPQLLELEITESMIMRDMEQTIGILKDLKQMGVRIAIDDFGSGYSSLSTLRQFPFDTIKIDGSFIHDVPCNAEDKSLMEAIIAVGRSLSLTVVAEGVETQDEADFLRSRACDQLQGFYINKPMPADEFWRLVRDSLPVTSPG